jgi:hypothetical protein
MSCGGLDLSLLGDAATWFGAMGTWVVGVAVAVIAGRQLYLSRFRPTVTAYRDGLGRIAVRITNRGNAPGAINSVHLLRNGQWPPNQPAIPFHLEINNGKAATRGAGSFPLAGLTTAQLVLLPVRPAEINNRVHAVVEYGTGERSSPVPLGLLTGAIVGSTSIPGIAIGNTGTEADPDQRTNANGQDDAG